MPAEDYRRTLNDTTNTLLGKMLKVMSAGMLGQVPGYYNFDIDNATPTEVTTNVGVTLSGLSRVGGFAATMFTRFNHTAALYAAGDSIANYGQSAVLRPGSLTGMLQSIQVIDGDGQAPELDLLISTNASAFGTATDNNPFVWGSEVQNCQVHVPVVTADYSTIGGDSVANVVGLNRIIDGFGGNGTLYVVAVARSNVTFTSASALIVNFGFLLD